MRRLIVAAALSCTFIVAFATAGAAVASAASMPAEGVFETCPLDTAMTTCVQRLGVMRQGGVNVVVISAEGESLNSLATYASAAHWLGMSVMWAIGDPGWWQEPSTSTYMSGFYPAFASACGCDQDGALLASTTRWLGSLPGTYGYYAADDSTLAPGDESAIASYVAEIKQGDPSHSVMIGSADQSQTNTYEGSADMVGAEIYPVTNSSLMPASANQDMWGAIGQTAADAQQAASRDSKQSAFILQAFTWGDNLSDGHTIGVCTPADTQTSCYDKLQYPSAAAQLQLRNEVIEHAHPSLILWWSFAGTYGQAGDDTYSVYPSGSVAASQWAGLSAAIQAPAPKVHQSSRRPVAHAARSRGNGTRKTRRGHKRRAHRSSRRGRTHHHRRHDRRHAFNAHAA